MRAVYPGTFNPFTLGHLDIAIRASRLFEKVFVAVAADCGREAIDVAKRKEMAEACLKDYANIEVAVYSGLTTEFAKENACRVIIRGVRDIVDMQNEKNLSAVYKSLGDFEFITMYSQNPHISASIVRELARFNADISGYVHKDIIEKVKKIYK